MTINKRYGTSLLAFNTKREPDPDRGKGIKHFELTLPSQIKDEFDKWEIGKRKALNPKDAAGMLWSTTAASHLDGRLDAWENIPVVKLLLPGWDLLTKLPQDSWPSKQSELKKLIAEAGNPSMTPAELIKQLKKLDSEKNLFNDLLLIFKYAAIGSQRPIHLVADLYRLNRTLLLDAKDSPSSVSEVTGYLTSPLIVPSVFTTPLGTSGPHVPLQHDIENKPPKPPRIVNFAIDKESPKYREIIKRIEKDLDEIDKIESDKATIRAIRNVAINDPKAKANIIEAVRVSNKTSLTDKGNSIIRRVMHKTSRRTSRNISRNIGGFPVLIDMAEIEKRKDKQREEKTIALLSSFPDDLKSRIDALDNNMYVLEVTDEIENTIPYHPPALAGPSYLKPAGRTDLLIVRQMTIGYRRAEIAHVENVLIGETRERDHTKRIFTRDELFESTERESEETNDLQTTDSSELSNEVNEVVSEDLRIEGSVEITYRGPTKVVAKAAGSFEKSSETTANVATEYATEIVDRAVKRIFERSKRETKSIFEQEIIEENRHHFIREKNAEEHVSGIYQYLERVSRAKIFSYGERDLYDILVPEPAALIWNLATSSGGAEDEIDPPDHNLFNSLTLDNIELKMEKIIKAFKVVSFPAALPSPILIEEGFSKTDPSGSTKNVYTKNVKVRIKEGYAVDKVTVKGFVENEQSDNHPSGSFTIGTKLVNWETGKGGGKIGISPLTFSPPQLGPDLGIAITAENFNGIGGIITIELSLTDERSREWQFEAYSRVAERYEQMKRDYDLAVIRAEATQPEEEIDLPSGARRRLKKMARNELQRAAIGIMRNRPVDYDLINDVAAQSLLFPTTDIPRLKAKEAEIQFLQQAFEWEHLSWVLYPYFWGRREGTPGWKNTVVQDHPDPDFAAFLNAGAARLQISVRPGFQDLVKHFMETGEVYEGNGLPKMGDPGYVPFIDEQINSLGGPGEEVQWPPENPVEWDVVTPTPLVLVRKVAEKQLPTWDADTGEEVE
ncbi:MAG: hypothetical protein COA50_16565 [Flavobacteriaceae bacterium]|nr:MAG: hypothetical protein COA50_16565 [Flavobacteriaceae bacterium]